MRWTKAMALRGLAPKTRLVYLSWVRRLVQFCRVVPDQLTPEQVRAYLLDLTQERQVAFSTFNQALNALRFFFRGGLEAGVGDRRDPLPEGAAETARWF